MSDFDKFFAEKLDGEDQFPRREKNWRTLSKRLDAFDTGLQHQVGKTRRYLRYWQAAAACTIITAACLAWKMTALQSENTGLHRQIASLQQKNAAAEQEIALLEKSQRGGNSASAASSESIDVREKPAVRTPPPFVSGSQTMSNYRQPGDKKVAEAAGGRTDISANGLSVPEIDLPAENQENNTGSGVAQPAEEVKPLYPATPLPDSVLQSMAAAAPLPDTVEKSPPDALPDTMTAVVTAPNIIEPARNPSRFRAGIQLLTGFPVPGEKGVSWMMGHGINAEYNLWRTFWLTASADWLRYDVSTDKYIPKFHSHHHHNPTPGGGPQEKLVSVESTQRQQQFALGIRYPLPVRSWIRPAVRVAYVMTHTSPDMITFKFEDQGGGGPGGPGGPKPPKYQVQNTESQLIGNIWRLGAGLEHETRLWSFGLWADYSKNFAANDATFDAIQFRAGLQYTFN